MRQKPSIVSIAAMVAGGKDGLPWRRARRQWRFAAHFDCYDKVARKNRSVSVFRQKLHTLATA